MSQNQAIEWRHLAEQASTETDPEKLMLLVTELNEVLERSERVSQKLRSQSSRPQVDSQLAQAMNSFMNVVGKPVAA
jgi:hypothetical protein